MPSYDLQINGQGHTVEVEAEMSVFETHIIESENFPSGIGETRVLPADLTS